MNENARTTRLQGADTSVVNPIRLDNAYDALVKLGLDVAYSQGYDKSKDNINSTLVNEAISSAKDAAVTETGNKEYWHSKDYENSFSDKEGKNSIELKDTITAKLPPETIEGTEQSLTAAEKKELTFRSNAVFGDFIRVELDGKTIDEKNYTAEEGSTVVTLKSDYVVTLSAGEHTIGVVSTSDTAAATFSVNAKAVVDNDTKSSQTGDNSHMALRIALLLVSGGALIGTTVISKKRKRSAR